VRQRGEPVRIILALPLSIAIHYPYPANAFVDEAAEIGETDWAKPSLAVEPSDPSILIA
jgi:hypothetical protein